MPLTVKHFLVECPSHGDTRQRLFPLLEGDYDDMMRYILAEQPDEEFQLANIINYLREIDLIDEII